MGYCMAGNREISIGLIGLAAVIALVALLTPWWSVTLGVQQAGSMTTDMGPFKTGDDMASISGASAVLTGILALAALLAFAAAAAIMVYSSLQKKEDLLTQNAPLFALGGAALLAVALVVAVFMYPAEVRESGFDVGFWGSQQMGQGITVSAAAALGWFMGIAAVLVSGAGGVLALRSSSMAEGGSERGTRGQES